MNKKTAIDKLGSSGVMHVVEQMDIETLRLLNHAVVSLIKHTQAHEAVALSYKFRVGDKVSFSRFERGCNDYGRKFGTIVKVNRVRAIVKVDNTRWNVPFSMITKG